MAGVPEDKLCVNIVRSWEAFPTAGHCNIATETSVACSKPILCSKP
jgi:hypothetical protein